MASILKHIFGNGGTTTYDPGPWAQGMVRYGNGYNGLTGGKMSTDKAMTLSAVFACIRLLSENVATMPLDTFTRRDGVRAPYRPRPEYLSFQPPQGSRIDYLSQIMLSLLSDGNAYVATPRGPEGEPITLVVMDPCKVKPYRNDLGVVWFEVEGHKFSDLDVMHIKAMLMPGAIKGLSPLAYASLTVDLGLQAQEFGASFFGNSAVPSGIVEAPGEVPRDLAERMAGLWDSRHKGSGNAGKIGVLTGGAKFSRITIAPNEAQFLETRQFQVPDIARFFGVPPHLIADASNSTSWGSGLAEQNAAFGQLSLRPWVDRIEDAHNRLLTSYGLPDVFVRLNMDAVLRASTSERYAAYQVGIESGWLLRSEVRTSEDLRPVEGIDDAPEAPQAAPLSAAEERSMTVAPEIHNHFNMEKGMVEVNSPPVTVQPGIVNVHPARPNLGETHDRI